MPSLQGQGFWKRFARAGRSRARGPALWLVLLICAFAALSAAAGGRFARTRCPVDDAVELALFPSGRLLEGLSFGRPRLMADFAWLAAIQYYGRHRQTDRRYPMADHLFRVITDCDPGFANAYLFGALILAEAGEAGPAEELLSKGMSANPGSWMLAFELGFFHYTYTHRWDDALAAFYRAAALPEAPEYVARFAAAAGEKARRPELAAQLWSMIALESENEEIRRIARDRLAALQASGPRPE
ncbi:MAG: hypothetical protein V1774_00960 [Candidatus Eisenbacteria bacterium]